MSSDDRQSRFAEIFADSGVEAEEMERLQERIDEVQAEALEQQGPDSAIAGVIAAFDATQLQVQGILSMRHRVADPVDPAQLRSIVEANIAFLQATLDAFPDRTPD